MARMETETKARRQRRRFTDEFRDGAVRLVLDEGKTVAQVASDLDLTPSSLCSPRWVPTRGSSKHDAKHSFRPGMCRERGRNIPAAVIGPVARR